MAKKGLNGEFQFAAGTLADQLAEANALVPNDLRRVVLLTPAERTAIEEGAAAVSDIRKSVADAARSQGDVAMAHGFVTGGSVVPTAAGIRAAIKLIVHNAEGHAALVADAGIGAEEMAWLAQLDSTLKNIELTKEARISEREKVVGKETMAAVAIERMVSLYRSRSRMACLGKRLTLALALEILPRTAPERRVAAGKGDKEDKKDAPGETPGKGAGNVEGEPPHTSCGPPPSQGK